MTRGERRGRRMALSLSAAGLCLFVAVAWLCRDRLLEVWDYHVVETGSPADSARVLARKLQQDPLHAAPYVALQVLDPERTAWVKAIVEALSGQTPAPPNQRKTYFVSPAVGYLAWELGPFKHLDPGVLTLLGARPIPLGPAVPYASSAASPEESRMLAALANDSPAVRLQALAVLVRLRSPSSVAEQWSCLAELKGQLVSHAWDRALAEVEARFDPRAVLAEIAVQPPSAARWRDCKLEWSLRAAGVRKLEAALPRLRELSVSTAEDVSIAAVRSLEDFTGPEADEALTHCLLGWQYYSFIRAGRELLERSPELVLKVLNGVEAPAECKEWQKFFQMQARIRLEEKGSPTAR